MLLSQPDSFVLLCSSFCEMLNQLTAVSTAMAESPVTDFFDYW